MTKHDRLLAMAGTQPTIPTRLPAKPREWPVFLLPLKLLASPGDTGLGDIMARTIGPIGGDAFKAWHQTIFGKSCGCNGRREEWNARFPLPF